MYKSVVFAFAALTVTACTQSQVQNVVIDGQLFCAVGQSTVAIAQVADTSGKIAPVLAKGASNAYVKAACALANGIAVAPPANPGGAPVVVIPAVSIPL